MHAEASLHRKLVLFAVQLEGYLVHFPNCHKYLPTGPCPSHLLAQTPAQLFEGKPP